MAMLYSPNTVRVPVYGTVEEWQNGTMRDIADNWIKRHMVRPERWGLYNTEQQESVIRNTDKIIVMHTYMCGS